MDGIFVHKDVCFFENSMIRLFDNSVIRWDDDSGLGEGTEKINGFLEGVGIDGEGLEGGVGFVEGVLGFLHLLEAVGLGEMFFHVVEFGLFVVADGFEFREDVCDVLGDGVEGGLCFVEASDEGLDDGTGLFVHKGCLFF